ncbi:MAG: sigma factor regulatory protein FecR, partial [Rhodospirillales bacterium]|nr:sigma factor regulatory protein FecR [Rhodospirillales bacterium]
MNTPGRHLKPSAAALDEAAARFRQLRDRPDDSELQQALRAWMSADPEHVRALDLVAGAWKNSASAGGLPSMRALRRSAHRVEPRFGEAPSRRTALRRAIAVVLLAAVTGSVAVATMDARRVRETYVTERGERLDAVLPDGSKLRINGDSEVRVGFGWLRRDVRLVRGEVEFLVAK